MRESLRREKEPAKNDATFVEALGEVIIATTELQGTLLRGAATDRLLAVAHDQKLRRDLLGRADGLDLQRALVKFDKAMEKIVEARWRCFGKATHPSLALQQPA